MTTAIGSNHHPSHIRESRGDRVFQYAIIALSVVLLVIVNRIAKKFGDVSFV